MINMNIYLIEDEGGEFTWVAAKQPGEAKAFYDSHDEGNQAKFITEISPATWEFEYVTDEETGEKKSFFDIMAEPRENDDPFFIAEAL